MARIGISCLSLAVAVVSPASSSAARDPGTVLSDGSKRADFISFITVSLTDRHDASMRRRTGEFPFPQLEVRVTAPGRVGFVAFGSPLAAQKTAAIIRALRESGSRT
jgi:hypothetical protein